MSVVQTVLQQSCEYATQGITQAIQRCLDVGTNECLELLQERACLYHEIWQTNLLEEHAANIHKMRLEIMSFRFKEKIEGPMRRLEEKAAAEEGKIAEWESTWKDKLHSTRQSVESHEQQIGREIKSREWAIADLKEKLGQFDQRIPTEMAIYREKVASTRQLAESRLTVAVQETAANEANYVRFFPLQQELAQLADRIRRM